MNLNNFIGLARQSWEENNPTMFNELRCSGKLADALQEAAERTYTEMCELEDAGFSQQEAWEMTRETYLLLPAEETHEELVSSGVALFNEAIALNSKILRHLRSGDEFEDE